MLQFPKYTFIFIALLWLAQPLQGSEPFHEADFSAHILEPWRWNSLEALDDYNVFDGIELDDDKLVFVDSYGLLFYDGFRVERVQFPQENSDITVFTIWCDKDERIFLSTNIGIFLYDQQQWKQLLEGDQIIANPNQLFVSNADGLCITAYNSWIYKIKNGKLIPLVQTQQWVRSLSVTGTNILMTFVGSNEVASCQFSEQGLVDTNSWKRWSIDSEPQHSWTVFAEANTGKAVVLGFEQGSGIYKYSEDIDAWKPHDLPIQYEDQGYYLWIPVSDQATLLIGRTTNFLRAKDEWFILDRSLLKQPSNTVFCFQRHNGNLVLGGRDGEVVEIDLGKSKWFSIEDMHFQCSGHDQLNWFIDRNGGIVSSDKLNQQYLLHEENVIDSPNLIIAAENGDIWAAGSHEGTAAVSWYNGETWQRNLHPDLGGRIGHLAGAALPDGRLIFGSAQERPSAKAGAVVYSQENSEYSYQIIPPTILPLRISSFSTGPEQTLYFGGFTLESVNTTFQTPAVETQYHSANWVDDIVYSEDLDQLFAGFWKDGLVCNQDGEWKQIDAPNQVISNRIVSLLSDKVRNNTIWVATLEGVSRYDNGDWIPNALPSSFGMMREEGRLAQSDDGSIWINQTDRSWYFAGKEERLQSEKAFKTIRYQPNAGSPIVEIVECDKVISEPANVYVKWKGTDYWSQTKEKDLRYSIKLDKQAWTDFDTDSDTTLLNVPGGIHSLNIRVKDLDGNIGHLDQAIIFEVRPPLWKQGWFLFCAVSLFALIIALSALLLRQRIRHLFELEELKLQFFTNISHELKTPLALIMGPLESLISKLPDGPERKSANTAFNNSQKMLLLIDQILEFRKMEYSAPEVNPVVQDVIEDLSNTVTLLHPLFEAKSIHFTQSYSHDNHLARYDSDKLERIVTNLLNNAAKYTEENGTVLLIVRVETNSNTESNNQSILKLTVEDNGMGISESKLKRIFEPFYRENAKNKRGIRGVGLGLSLVKILLDQINGTIEVESPAAIEDGKTKGTRFKVSIPLDDPSTLRTPAKTTSAEAQDTTIDKDQRSETPNYNDDKIVLVVEDDEELAKFIGEQLSGAYVIEYANNGMQGFEKAKSIIPNLILTDVIMPEMDGNELCAAIRNESSTAHIPVIMLTALKSGKNELRSLTKGADDFLNKPVSIAILKQKVQNAIQSRITLQKAYQGSFEANKNKPTAQGSGSADDPFLRRVDEAILNHLEDLLFDVESMAELMKMSRMTLYRKIKAITGESPSTYIRNTRLKHAAVLLIRGDHNISEISLLTGFQELSHFSSTFKKRYKCTPSEYARNNND